MGAPLTKDQVISLTRELIKGTTFEANLEIFKRKRGIVDSHGNVGKLGTKWYYGFIKRQSSLVKRCKSTIKEKSRTSWCTYANFSNMLMQLTTRWLNVV